MYTGDDGESHYEEIDLSQPPDWTSPLATTHIVFRTDPAGKFQDWHPAPRRQFVIILSGQLEIGFGDGTKRVFDAGDARLVEDTTGKGHRSRVIGDEDVLNVAIQLD